MTLPPAAIISGNFFLNILIIISNSSENTPIEFIFFLVSSLSKSRFSRSSGSMIKLFFKSDFLSEIIIGFSL